MHIVLLVFAARTLSCAVSALRLLVLLAVAGARWSALRLGAEYSVINFCWDFILFSSRILLLFALTRVELWPYELLVLVLS